MADEKNKGGILGGLGYVGAGLAAGIGSVGEGIIDLLLAGGGLLTGNVDYAKHVFKDNTVGNWFADVTEDFNPGTGWEFAGNVTHGLGQSSVFLLNLIPGLGQLGTAAFFAGVGSQGISSAAATTGDVGFKEVAYGVASGAVEGALEKAFGGMGKAVKTLGGSTMKNITKTAVRKGLVKQVLSDAAGEFGEEFASEYIDTFLQRGFQIDPNKQYSFRDALYAGAVGFTSGAVSAGSANIIKAIGNERVGDRIVKSGNSQTLVNTATKVADKLAAQGTNWDRAGEWIKALRGQVDAYSKLSENEKTGMRGKTILGEMKSSLFFAETQSTFDLVKKSIQDSDEQTRATFAEYINRSVEKGKRNGKDYTAADIAKDTDGVAWQLAIYKFVPSLFDIDGALADMQQESEIADVVAKAQNGEAIDGQYSFEGYAEDGKGMYRSNFPKGTPKTAKSKVILDYIQNVWSKNPINLKINENGETKTITAQFDPTYSEDKNVRTDASKLMGGNRHGTASDQRVTLDLADDYYQIASESEYNYSKDETGKDTPTHEGVRKWHYFVNDIYFSEFDGEEYKPYRVTINVKEKSDGNYVYSFSAEAQEGSSTPQTLHAVVNGDNEVTANAQPSKNIIRQKDGVVNPESKKISSNYEIDENGENSRFEAVEGKTVETGEDPSSVGKPTPSPEGEGSTKVDLERAKRDAERIIEWERKEAPTVDELNRVRGAVKNFDSLSGDRQRAIVRMVRSGKNIDEGVIRGVSNIMAITNKKGAVLAPDVEIRFAEFGKDSTRRGIKTEVGGKTVILLNANAKSTDILRGTIAHEIVHYLENRKGYKALADFAMKHAKAEKVAQVRGTYKGVYKGENAEAKIEGEVVASVVAEMLNSEKFLKRYAQMGEEQGSVIKRIAKFVKGIANALKEKDDKAGAVAADMMKLVDKALGSEVAREKTGEKASFDLSPDEVHEWEKPITIDDVETLRSIGRKSINSFSAEDIKKAQKWAYKFYKELGVKSPFFRAWFGEWRAHDKSNVKVVDTKADNRKEVINADTGWKVQTSKKVHKETMHHLGSAEANAVKYLPYIDDITKKAILFQTEISNKDNPNSLMFHTMYAYTEVMGYPALLKLKVEELFYYNNKESGEITRDYILQNIEEESLSKSNRLSRPNHLDQNSSILSISDLYDLVNTFDKEFSPAPEVNEYMLNEDGTPKVFYHGTNADFTVFDLKKSGANFGVVSEGMFFFTDKKKAYPSSAEDYAKYVTNAKGGKEKIYDCYLKMHKPLVLDSSRSYDPISYYDRNAEKIYEKYFEGDYDGIIVTDFSKKNSTSTLALVDNSAQIKSATNNIGTFDKSEPDIRYDLDPEAVKRETEKQKKKTTTKAEPKGIKTGSAEAGEVAANMMDLVDRALGSEVEGEKTGEKYSVIQKNGVYYTPTDEEIIKNHPTINGVIINNAEYSEGHTLPDDEYKAYRKSQAEKARKVVGTYTNKDTTYSDEYGLITAEFKTPAIRKGKSYGGIALYDILPYVPQIFENAVVINTKPDSEANTNIKGIVNLVGCAILNNKYVAVVKLNVKEYANDEAKIYDNRVIEIEELTVVDRVGHQEVKTSSDSTSSAVSSKYIIAKFREFVKNNDKKKSMTNSDIKNSTEQYDLDPEAVAKKSKSKVATARAEGVLAGQMSQGRKDAVKLRKAEEKLEAQKEKSQESLAKYKKKVAVNKEKMRLKSRERVRNAKVKAEQSIREKMAREEANAAKAERARLFTKKEVAPLVSEIEGLTDEQVRSLAKGYELEGMSVAQKERIISDIYIALHEASAEGEAGPGSVAVKGIATRIARDMVQSAKIKGEDGKYYHLIDIYDEASVQAIASEYADVLYERFANMGQHTKYSYFVADLRAAEEEFRRDRIDDNAIHKLSREVSYQGQQLRRLVETQKRGMEDEGIQKVTKILASVVDAKGNIVTSKVDEAIGEADRFFNMESGRLDSQSQAQEGTALTEFAYSSDANLKFMIDEFKRLRAQVDKHGKDRTGKFLDAQEMRLLGKILAGIRKTVTEYNKVFINERYVDIDKVASDGATDIVEYHSLDKKAKTKVGELFDTLMRGVKQSYFYNVLTPETTIEALEGFKIGGVLKTLYHDVRIHKQKAEHLAVQMKKPFADYLDSKENVWTDTDGKKHSFRDKLNKKMINYNGAELTLGEAIYLYMLTKRELTHAGLKENGYIVYDENNQRRLKLKIEDVENVRNEIGNQLDDADKAFLKMAEEFFNKISTEVKNEADMRIFGYTNIEDGYYVPMIRDRYSRMQGVTDQRQSVGSIITVYNKSFNQNTVQNAKALEGKNIMSIINDHADGLADYSELYIPLKSFDRVYNKAVTVNGETRSIREILNDEVWNKTGSYLRDLFADIQGQNRKSDNVIDSMVGKLRSAWVNSVLGLNLKVVATQTTSFVAANQVIEAKYLMPAMKKFFGNQSELGARADKYSDIIEPRSFEMGALRAQGNIDKVMEWSSKTGFMINLMDRRVCLAVFHAAELKAEAQGAGAVGTVENAKAAAKIADEAIYTTQAMTSASERSALQRSKSEIARTLSMFTSDSVKNLSHFVGNIMKYQAHKARAKSDLASKAQYEAELKKDARAIRRSAKTLVMTGVMLGLITQAFKYLYAKEEEEPEEKAKDLATDVISSTFNILPGVSDIIDKFVFDYDLSLNVFDVANDTIEDTASLMNMAGRAMAGEYVSGDKVFKNVFNFVKTVGAASGAPIAPVERTVTGLLRRFFPPAIYGYDSMMSNPSYSADLKAAVEDGDEALAEHILETIYKNEATGVYSTPELEAVSDLYQKGYTGVIPQKIGATVNDVKLDRKQRVQFEKIYGEASAKVNELIRSEYYAELDDGQRAKAIKNIYSLYYNRAASEVAGVEWSNAQAYSRLTNNLSALFAAQAYKSGLSPYKTLRGKEVSVKEQFVDYVENLRLSDADKLVVLYANGYRDAATKKKMLAYINALSISEDEKAKIAERLGFAVENGKVVEKKEELEVRAE